MDLRRIELLTPCLQSRCSTKLSYRPPIEMVGPSEFESLTPALSARCSNQLSYGPVIFLYFNFEE